MDIVSVLAQYENSLMASDLSPNTVEFYLNHIRLFINTEGITRLEQFDSAAMESYLGRLKRKGCADSYRNIHYRCMYRFSNWVVKRPALAKMLAEPNPVSILEPVRVKAKQPLPFTLNEVKMMLRTIRKTSRYPLRDEAILTLLFDTGMRRGELVTLRFQDIEWEACTLHVTGKMGRRPVYISKRTLRYLKRYVRDERKEAPGAAHIVFTTQQGFPMKPRALTLVIRRMAKRAGIAQKFDDEGNKRRYLGPHALRHGFAVAYLDAGGDEFHLQKAMGHRSLRMTSRYVNRPDTEMARVHQVFSPLERLRREQGE